MDFGEAVGVVAAQAIGEPGTQLTMRTFHLGGVAGAADITAGLPHVEEIFELRTPRFPAVLSTVQGEVLEVREEGTDRVVKVLIPPENRKGAKEDHAEFIVPFGKAVRVSVGATVAPGTPLSDGGVNIQELYQIAGTEAAEKHILEEVSKVYTIQGATINEKHIEIIVRQIFSRVRVQEVGDTQFSEGEIVEHADFVEENQRVQAPGGVGAKGETLATGITRVALTTSSFLSAASFQETARVLISAALDGRKDRLRGLKENVIIGHLIPAGTGLPERRRIMTDEIAQLRPMRQEEALQETDDLVRPEASTA